ncbi:MAG: DUF1150 family protein [Kiloniellales bacterium]
MDQVVERLRQLSPADFAILGVQHVAFVKQVVTRHHIGWSIHTADGTQIAVADQRDVAFATVRQHELEPLSVH